MRSDTAVFASSKIVKISNHHRYDNAIILCNNGFLLINSSKFKEFGSQIATNDQQAD